MVFGIFLLPNIFLPKISGEPILVRVAVLQEGLQLWEAGGLPGLGKVFNLLAGASGAAPGWLALSILNRGQAIVINEVNDG